MLLGNGRPQHEPALVRRRVQGAIRQAGRRRHGALKGAALAAWRLLRCNPWSLGGVDHVPPRGRWSNDQAHRGSAGGVEHEGSDEGTATRTLGADTSGARTSAPQDR
ncbi:membrane protein insertion efficiency factor YidD [Georgenia sp. SUBG003]|uniref:membrane protein insertion efficiency factor YidD n=1 Tax=Georgenia sp. SUBG003 TaxID=1497974 RepID=UPI003AB7600C